MRYLIATAILVCFATATVAAQEKGETPSGVKFDLKPDGTGFVEGNVIIHEGVRINMRDGAIHFEPVWERPVETPAVAEVTETVETAEMYAPLVEVPVEPQPSVLWHTVFLTTFVLLLAGITSCRMEEKIDSARIYNAEWRKILKKIPTLLKKGVYTFAVFVVIVYAITQPAVASIGPYLFSFFIVAISVTAPAWLAMLKLSFQSELAKKPIRESVAADADDDLKEDIPFRKETDEN